MRQVILCVIIATGISLQTVYAQTYSGITVFGDSLSDTGNQATRFSERVLPPPYDEGRWSNGPVWVEYLAQQLALPLPAASTSGGTNYAWGGGTTGSIPGLGINIDMQVNTYLQDHTPGNAELFVVLGGVNDSFLGQRNASVAVDKLMESISRLSDAGARHFLVSNLPEKVGIYQSLNDQLKVFVPSFNERLWSALDDLQANSDGVSVHKVDFHRLYDDIVADPNGFGFTDVTHPACVDCSRWDGNQLPPGYVFANVVPNPEQFYLWDDIHPSSAVHRLISEAAYAAIVPEPSTEQSLAFAFFGLAVACRAAHNGVRRGTPARRP
ncbi:MAG: SGNH/GDSL hydrolase family protein [Planctomycetales bacterium]|nr:SGNH/GDSL hydrolase family protein [Planctomycetales bacterium]